MRSCVGGIRLPPPLVLGGTASPGTPPPPPSAAACSAKKKEKVILFSGPTGAGKRRFSLESADSVQVYQGLDVGPTKPSFGERKEPHHLVDILHPSEEYSVGQFFEDARQATRDILNNGRVPIIMGGTGVILTMVRLGKNGVEEVLGVRLRKTRTGKSQTQAQIFY